MSTAQDALHGSDAPAGRAASLFERLSVRLGRLSLPLAGPRNDLWRLAGWLEVEAFEPAKEAGCERVRLAVEPETGLRLLGPSDDDLPAVPEGLERLANFLADIGVRELALDVRLEQNQITDVLTLVWAVRRRLRRSRPAVATSLVGRLQRPDGVQYACSRVCIIDGRLEITYSYCVTAFSRLVFWFKRTRTRFADHRALFHAAPRYALLAAAVALLPVFVYALWGPSWPFVAVTVAVAAAEFGLVYLFFMAVGSVEYDSEEKSHRLEVAYSRLDRYARRIQDDLKRARSVQRRMLPDAAHMPLANHLQWASSFEPADQVGGDFYDAMIIGPGRVAIAFGDVSGHDMAAAFVTAILKTAFQSWLDEGGSLVEFVARLNRRLCGLVPDDSFAAVFLAIYDAGTGDLTYVNGGHNPEPWLLGAGDDRRLVSLDQGRALLLGVIDPIAIDAGRVHLSAGDAIVFVTDGVIEAADIDGEFYGSERLEALLDACRDEPTEELVRRIQGDVQSFLRGAEQGDDQTILAFRVQSDA